MIIYALSLNERVKTLFDFLKLKILSIREFQLDLSMGQFFGYMYLLYSTHQNVITSVEYAADAVENQVIRKSLFAALPLLRQGKSISESLSVCPYIQGGYLATLFESEHAGKLDEAFAHIVKRTMDSSEVRMEIIQRTLFRFQAFAVAMSIVLMIFSMAMAG
jgi:type II secretory pathway component PulF